MIFIGHLHRSAAAVGRSAWPVSARSSSRGEPGRLAQPTPLAARSGRRRRLAPSADSPTPRGSRHRMNTASSRSTRDRRAARGGGTLHRRSRFDPWPCSPHQRHASRPSRLQRPAGPTHAAPGARRPLAALRPCTPRAALQSLPPRLDLSCPPPAQNFLARGST